MIGDLMLFARPPAPTPQRLLLNDVVLSVLDRFARQTRLHALLTSFSPLNAPCSRPVIRPRCKSC